MNLREQAQAYADLGICVIPIWHGGKRPTRAWTKYQKQPPSAAELDMWFGAGGNKSNIAVVGGGVSGNLVVLDFDDVEGYLAWVERAQAAADQAKATEGDAANAPLPWPQTLPTYTTGRGYHVWLRTEQPLNTYVGQVTGTTHEVHVRAEGAYAVCPPSLHETGRKYAWTGKLVGIPVVPVIPAIRAVDAIPRGTESAYPQPVDPAGAEQQDGLLPAGAPMTIKLPSWAVDILNEEIPVGKRHRKLLSVCGWARGQLHEQDCLQLMRRVNQACCPDPLPAHEIRSMVRSLYRQPGPRHAPMAGGLPDDWPEDLRSFTPLQGAERANETRAASLARSLAGERANEGIPPCITCATETEGLDLKPPEWLVKHIALPGTVTVLVAPSGCIKTWAAMWWWREVARGPDGGLRALYVDQESGDAELIRRYRKMGVGGAHNCFYWFYPGLALDMAPDAKEFVRIVSEVDPKFVVIDSLRRFITGDENTSGAIDALYDCLAELKALDVAVLLLHHSKKRGGGIVEGEMGRGSSDVKAMADTYIECSPKGTTKILVKWNKMRCEPAPESKLLSLREDPDTGSVELVWDEAEHEDAMTGRPEERLLATANAEPGLGITELAAAADVTTSDVSRLVRALVAEGKLVTQMQGKKKAVYPGPRFQGAEERGREE